MHHKKNLDFVALIWEDLAYQIDNKDSKKQDKIFYPRFMKIISHHFLTKDKSILMRNKTFMHTARDDSLLGTTRFVSRHEDTQVYGDLLPKAMMNQSLLDFVAYKTYYGIATRAEPPKPKKIQKKSDSAISSEETSSRNKPTKAKKYVASTKKPASKPKSTKKKAPVNADRGKSLNILLEVALYEAAQLKEATKQSKKDFHISHESGSGNGADFESGVPNEQQRKISDDDDEDDTEDDDGNDDGDDSDGNDDNDNDADNAKEENEEELDDTEELYKDVNVNLRKKDVEMTNADQGGANQHNVSQESGFKQE
ncbi:hypothetical protein Tco_1479650, partial [Tanacetum coccineum]